MYHAISKTTGEIWESDGFKEVYQAAMRSLRDHVGETTDQWGFKTGAATFYEGSFTDEFGERNDEAVCIGHLWVSNVRWCYTRYKRVDLKHTSYHDPVLLEQYRKGWQEMKDNV